MDKTRTDKTGAIAVGAGAVATVGGFVALSAWREKALNELVDGKRVSFEKFDPAKIGADPEAFQFKGGGDAAGVTERLRGVTKWDPVAAGKAVVFERADGTRVIADGHQRLGLAKRIAGAGEHVRLDGYLFRERDGWKPKDVRAYAALKNIKELSGAALDMAKVVRERPDLIDGSVPMSDAKIKEAMSLSRLSDKAFKMVVGGAIRPELAAAVGEQVKDASRHAGMLGELVKGEVNTIQQARLYVGQALAAPTIAEHHASLFGNEVETRSLVKERTAVLDKALSVLKSDKKVFATLEREAARIETAGNKLARSANAARAESAGQIGALVEKLATRHGPVSSMLDEAARSVAAGQQPSAAARSFVQSLTQKASGAGGLNALITGNPVPAVAQQAPKGQASFLPEATTAEKIAAGSRAIAGKGRVGDPMNDGLFGSSSQQTDLVDEARTMANADRPRNWKAMREDRVLAMAENKFGRRFASKAAAIAELSKLPAAEQHGLKKVVVPERVSVHRQSAGGQGTAGNFEARLNALKKTELQAVAKELRLGTSSRMTNAELRSAIHNSVIQQAHAASKGTIASQSRPWGPFTEVDPSKARAAAAEASGSMQARVNAAIDKVSGKGPAGWSDAAREASAKARRAKPATADVGKVAARVNAALASGDPAALSKAKAELQTLKLGKADAHALFAQVRPDAKLAKSATGKSAVQRVVRQIDSLNTFRYKQMAHAAEAKLPPPPWADAAREASAKARGAANPAVDKLAGRFKSAISQSIEVPRYGKPATMAAAEAKLRELYSLKSDLKAAKLSRSDKLALAQAVGNTEITARASGAAALDSVTRRIDSLTDLHSKLLANSGTPLRAVTPAPPPATGGPSRAVRAVKFVGRNANAIALGVAASQAANQFQQAKARGASNSRAAGEAALTAAPTVGIVALPTVAKYADKAGDVALGIAEAGARYSMSTEGLLMSAVSGGTPFALTAGAGASGVALKGLALAGKVAGKLALPVTVAMAAYEGVEGYKREGAVGAVKGVADSLTFGLATAAAEKARELLLPSPENRRAAATPRSVQGLAYLNAAAARKAATPHQVAELGGGTRTAAAQPARPDGMTAGYTRVGKNGQTVRVHGYRTPKRA